MVASVFPFTQWQPYIRVEPSVECLERSSSNLFFCWLQDLEKLKCILQLVR